MTKILIADDDQKNLYLLSFLLEKRGHEVEAVKNGQEALDAARKNPPDLIITDILMPVMDGFTLCRNWQRDAMLKKIPLVFYSATYTGEKDVALGLSLGAVRFIIKPMAPEALYAVLEEVVEEHSIGNLTPPSVELESEPIFLKQYNERLVKKLEDKMVELEDANQRLEEEVAARTAELKVALEEAQAASRLKSRFISNINHELRTPLHNLIFYLSFLDQGRIEKRPEYISILRREAERLQWLIDQLLAISRLEAGSISANLEPVNVNQLAETLVNDRKQLAQDKKIGLVFTESTLMPPAQADPKLLFQCLTNLVSNAINYTLPGGHVNVQTGVTRKDDQSWVTVTVQDDGIGISEEDQAHLFERFYRGDAADMTHVSGAGIGLSICREFIELLGGEVTIESHLGQGSRFTLWLQPA